MTGPGFGCPRVFWNLNKQTKVVGRTMDLFIDDAPWMAIYPRGMERDGKAGDNLLEWKSKYVSQ